jgi:hypothetical protein
LAQLEQEGQETSGAGEKSMTIFTDLDEARRTLGVEPGAGDGALKQAYRAALRDHPPDRDPEGFRAVRRAYEVLSDPVSALQERLKVEAPLVDPPRARSVPAAPPGATALELLRAIVARLPADELLGDKPERQS